MTMLANLSPLVLLSALVACISFLDQPRFEQQSLSIQDGQSHSDSPLKVRLELRKAEIIPTVVEDFTPSLSLTIAWPWEDTSNYNVTSELGNTLDPKRLQRAPNAYVDTAADDDSPDLSSSGAHNDDKKEKKKPYPELVLTLTDPDAPSRDDPKWSEVCHWIVAAKGKHSLNEVVEYKPPGPPPKTGKHRYVFLAWVAANKTTDELHLSKPADRRHWGYDPDVDGDAGRVGVRHWAKENGLVPVAANFVYAQNEKQ